MTAPSELQIASHGRQLGTLLPPGRAWSQEPGGTQLALLTGFGHEFANLEARLEDLLREQDPLRTLELLPDWEAAFGLPDDCVGVPSTIEERRAAVVARLVALAGGSAFDLRGLAATLGFDVRIIEHRPFEAGRSRAGDMLTNVQTPFRAGLARAGDALTNLESWPWTVDVVAPLTTVRRFAAGRSVAGERLAAWNNQSLECTLSRVAPAHVLLRFLYELQTKLEAAVGATAAPIPALFTALFDPDHFDDMTERLPPLVNAVSPITGELWGLDGTTNPIELPPAFVTAEMFRNGGTLRWQLSGQYANDTGSPVDLELAFYNGPAAVTPFMTICVEGLPSVVGSNGGFTLTAYLNIRGTNQAHGHWLMIANPLIVADGSTAGGQATAFIDYDVLRMFAFIDWTVDTLIVHRLRKKTASAAVVKVFEISVIPDVVRSGVSAR